MHSKPHRTIPNALLHESEISMAQLDQKVFFPHAVKVISGIDEKGYTEVSSVEVTDP